MKDWIEVGLNLWVAETAYVSGVNSAEVWLSENECVRTESSQGVVLFIEWGCNRLLAGEMHVSEDIGSEDTCIETKSLGRWLPSLRNLTLSCGRPSLRWHVARTWSIYDEVMPKGANKWRGMCHDEVRAIHISEVCVMTRSYLSTHPSHCKLDRKSVV